MVNYLRSAFAPIFVMACCLYACRSKEVVPELPPDHVAIKVNKSLSLTSGITVRVDAISDSRCPIGYNCFLAGEAITSVTVSTETDYQKRVLTAGFYKDRSDSMTIQVKGVVYKVILRNVIPHPSSKNLKPKQQAVIQVSRL